MIASQWKSLLCIVVAISALQAQYIPSPNATRLNRQAPYLNPSVNDPLFFDSNNAGFVRGAEHLDETVRQEAIKFLGSSIYYDGVRKIFINIVTGDYYDPTTGLIYRRVAADRIGFVNGRVGPNPVSANYAPYEKSDSVDIPRDLKEKYLNQIDGIDSDEDCHDCERKGQCLSLIHI